MGYRIGAWVVRSDETFKPWPDERPQERTTVREAWPLNHPSRCWNRSWPPRQTPRKKPTKKPPRPAIRATTIVKPKRGWGGPVECPHDEVVEFHWPIDESEVPWTRPSDMRQIPHQGWVWARRRMDGEHDSPRRRFWARVGQTFREYGLPSPTGRKLGADEVGRKIDAEVARRLAEDRLTEGEERRVKSP